MGTVDAIVLLWLAISALAGALQGFASIALALGGLVGGGLATSRLAPLVLPDSDESPWLSVVVLAGALIGLTIAIAIGRSLLTRLPASAVRGPARTANRVGGAIAGAVVGAAIVWILAVVALNQEGLRLRDAVHDSAALSTLVDLAPPDAVLGAVARFDPFPTLPALRDLTLPPPDPSVLQRPETRRAAASVVKLEGVSCGLGISGSGWVVRPGVVMTNVHVVTGRTRTRVLAPDGQRVNGTTVYVDPANDIAVVRAPGLRAAPLPVGPQAPDRSVVSVLGYPGGGALATVAARVGSPVRRLSRDAYERQLLRTVVPLRAEVRQGMSGGPVIDTAGRVTGVIFGSTSNGRGGFAAPVSAVARASDASLARVSAGPCPG